MGLKRVKVEQKPVVYSGLEYESNEGASKVIR